MKAISINVLTLKIQYDTKSIFESQENHDWLMFSFD